MSANHNQLFEKIKCYKYDNENILKVNIDLES